MRALMVSVSCTGLLFRTQLGCPFQQPPLFIHAGLSLRCRRVGQGKLPVLIGGHLP
jgi:hypothetical protein